MSYIFKFATAIMMKMSEKGDIPDTMWLRLKY